MLESEDKAPETTNHIETEEYHIEESYRRTRMRHINRIARRVELWSARRAEPEAAWMKWTERVHRVIVQLEIQTLP